MGSQTDTDDKAPSAGVTGSTIGVTGFKQILFLPLRLAGNSDVKGALKQQIDSLVAAGDRWEPVSAPHASHRLDPAATGDAFDRFSYQEFVYFHPFIQDILFPKKANRSRPEGDDAPASAGTRIFRRTGLEALEIDLPGGHPYRLKIDRLWLYLFEIGVAIAMVELHACPTKPALAVRTLDDVLRVQNAVRRVYPPYFGIKKLFPGNHDLFADGQPWDGSREIVEYPEAVRLFGTHLESAPIKTDWQAFEASVRERLTTPFAPQWAELLAPLSIEGAMARKAPDKPEEAAPSAGPLWQQTMDERLPSMTFLSSPQAGRMQFHHWARLGSMDDPGESCPYNPGFLKQHFSPGIYDRHWREDRVDSSKTWGTRYVMSGYSFICCGTSGAFLDKLISHHFSRIYADMGLLLHLQHAALLSLSGELSQLADSGEGDLENHQQQMKRLQGRFNTFVQKFWFSNVSNQLQAREMYGRWKAALELDRLYAEVNEQMKDAAAYLDSRFQMQQAEQALRLNRIATLGVPAAVATGILGMNVVVSDKVIPYFDLPAMHWMVGSGVIATLFAIAYALLQSTSDRSETSTRKSRFVEGVLGIVIGIAVVAFLAGLFRFISPIQPEPAAPPVCCQPAPPPEKP